MSSKDKVNLDNYVVKEFTSANGAKFAVAYPKEAGYTTENLETGLDSFTDGDTVKVTSTDDSWIGVSWPLDFDSDSDGLDQQVIDLGISSSDLYDYTGEVWSYILHFENTKGWGFQFKDATGDIYKVSTILNGWHYLLYNSSKPEIVGVK